MKLKLLTMCMVIVAALAFSANARAQTGVGTNLAVAQYHACVAQFEADNCAGMKNPALKECLKPGQQLCNAYEAPPSAYDIESMCATLNLDVCKGNRNAITGTGFVLGFKTYIDQNNATHVVFAKRSIDVNGVATDNVLDVIISNSAISYLGFSKDRPVVLDANYQPVEMSQSVVLDLIAFLEWEVVLDDNGDFLPWESFRATIEGPNLANSMTIMLDFAAMLRMNIDNGVNAGLFVKKDPLGGYVPMSFGETTGALWNFMLAYFLNPQKPPDPPCSIAECQNPFDGTCIAGCPECYDMGGFWMPPNEPKGMCMLTSACEYVQCTELNLGVFDCRENIMGQDIKYKWSPSGCDTMNCMPPFVGVFDENLQMNVCQQEVIECTYCQAICTDTITMEIVDCALYDPCNKTSVICDFFREPDKCDVANTCPEGSTYCKVCNPTPIPK